MTTPPADSMKSPRFGYKEMAAAQAQADAKNKPLKLPVEDDGTVSKSQAKRTAVQKAGSLKYAVVCQARIVLEDSIHEINYVQVVEDPETDIIHITSPNLVTSTLTVQALSSAADIAAVLHSLTPDFVVSVPL